MSLLRRIERGGSPGKDNPEPEDSDEFRFDEETVPELAEDPLTKAPINTSTQIQAILRLFLENRLLRWLYQGIASLISSLSWNRREILATTAIALIVIVIVNMLWLLRDFLTIPGIISLAVIIVIFAISLRVIRTDRDLVEERLERYQQGYQSFLEIEEELGDSSLEESFVGVLSRFEQIWYPGKRTRHRLDQANLKITLTEYVAIKIIFLVLVVWFTLAAFPESGAILASVLGAFAYVLLDIAVSLIARVRLRKFDDELVPALGLWISALQSGQTVTQSFNTLAQSDDSILAFEFRRVLVDLQLGNSIEEALARLQRRLPSRDLKLVIDAIHVNMKDKIALDTILRSVQEHLQRIQQIRLRNGYIVYAHDLMFPIVVGLLYIQSYVLAAYFVPNVLQSFLTLSIAYAAITVAMIIVGETGKQLRRLEIRYGLPSSRSASITAIIRVVRLVSFALFFYYHLLQPDIVYILWAWFLLLCLETPYAIIPILITMVIAGTQLQLNIDFSSISTIFVSPLSLSLSELLIAFVALVALTIVIATWRNIRQVSNRDALVERLAQFAERDEFASLRDVELSLNVFERLLLPALKPISNFLTPIAPVAYVESIRKKLNESGSNLETTTFIAWQIALTCLFPLGIIYLVGGSSQFSPDFISLCIVATGIAGFLIPALYLESQKRFRHQVVQEELPAFLLQMEMRLRDKTTVLATFEDIYLRWDSIIALGLGKVVKMTQLGATIDQAVSTVVSEWGNSDLKHLGAAVIQFQKSEDALLLYLADLRERNYRNQETMIRNFKTRYGLLHGFAGRYMLWVGLAIWILSPLIVG